MQTPSIAALMEAVGISKTYASDILADRQRPSRPLAIHIYRKTGWKPPVIASLTEEQMAVFEQVDPWTPRQPREAAA